MHNEEENRPTPGLEIKQLSQTFLGNSENYRPEVL